MPKPSATPTFPAPGPPTEATKEIAVVADKGNWLVAAAGRARSGKVYPTQAGAIDAAQAAIRVKGGAMTVHREDGRVERTFILGRQAFEKISAVEGIRLSGAMKRDLAEARANAKSFAEARQMLATKYGRGRT